MLTRRDLLTASAGAALLAATARPFAAVAQTAPSTAPSTAPGAALNTLLDAFFTEDLTRHPESATLTGLDTGALAPLRARLTDRSPAGVAADKAATKDQLRRLKALDRAALTGIDAVNYDCVAYVLEQRARMADSFDFGSVGERSPYTISQLTGSYQSIPTFLDTKHKIADKQDADAYLARLEAFAVGLDHDTDRMKADVGKGVIPPDFVLDTTLGQLKSLQTAPADAVVVASIARRAKDLDGDYGAQAARIFQEKVLPALERQGAAVADARAKATHDAGVWHIKDGAEWYAQGLAASTTTTLPPAEVHQMGLDQAADLTSRIDTILKQQGMTRGTVGERVKALYAKPEYLYPNTDEGKVRLVADLQARLDAMMGQLPRFFHTVPKAKVVVERVPKFIEVGAPNAYYQRPALDGSRPGTIYFNLHDTAEWPKWALSTTAYHEGVPGHHLQGSTAQETAGIPRYRSGMFFSGYGEGWALYAEQLADELGVYDNDPLGRLGYLKALLFRAGRLVVDTGMHHMRWSREKAVTTMVDLLGETPSALTREIDRYCTWPGQACSYKIGHTTWNRLRDEAKAKLGPKYDIRDFHQAGLTAGVMPLDVLDRVIKGYIQTKA